MRSVFVKGICAESFAKSLKELHTKRYHYAELSYYSLYKLGKSAGSLAITNPPEVFPRLMDFTVVILLVQIGSNLYIANLPNLSGQNWTRK
jgi:hypothetical protein